MRILLFFICIACCLVTKAQYKNLVFEGGGTRGLAYAGVVKVLDERGILPGIENVAGTSVGSIVGLMISLGYRSAEIDSVMFGLKIQKFNDGGGGLIGKFKRTKKFYGIHKGDVFGEWLGELIATKTGNPDLTFRQLDSLRKQNNLLKAFSCVGTNLSRQRAETFSLQHTPDMPIRIAVRISCSIPFYYEPVLLDSSGIAVTKPIRGYNYQAYADGGILANYPINIFDSCVNGGDPLFCDSVNYNNATLGFKLERKEQIEQYRSGTNIASYNIKNLKEYGAAFFNLMMETMNRRPGLANEAGRTVYIPYVDLFSNPKKISTAEKKELYENGRAATVQFFDSK